MYNQTFFLFDPIVIFLKNKKKVSKKDLFPQKHTIIEFKKKKEEKKENSNLKNPELHICTFAALLSLKSQQLSPIFS